MTERVNKKGQRSSKQMAYKEIDRDVPTFVGLDIKQLRERDWRLCLKLVGVSNRQERSRGR